MPTSQCEFSTCIATIVLNFKTGVAQLFTKKSGKFNISTFWLQQSQSRELRTTEPNYCESSQLQVGVGVNYEQKDNSEKDLQLLRYGNR